MNKAINQKLNWTFTPSTIEILVLIFGSSLIIWHAWIMDDAYVYFRYVDNLIIHNLGLVWNEGEYIEGFSSPLWALYLSALRLLQLDYWNIIRLTAVICFFLFWYFSCLVNRGLISHKSNINSLNLPLVYLGFTYAISSYFSSGLETPLVIVSASIYAAGIIWPHSKVFQLLIGLSPLVRHELALPFIMYLFWAYIFKRTLTSLAILAFIVSVGGYEVFRIWYYADLFPNTFYLKDEVSILQGLYYIYDTIISYHTVPYLLAMGLVFWLFSKQKEVNLFPKERLAMIILSLPVLLYVIKIGGDPRHFRYLAFPYVLIILASGGLIELLHSNLINVGIKWMHAALVVLAICIGMSFPRQLQQHPIFRSSFGYQHNAFLKINDSAVHRLNATRITPHWDSFHTILSYHEAKQRYDNNSVLDATDLYKLKPNYNWIKPVKCKDPTKLVSAANWCQTAYLNASSQVVHSLGLTEPFLARVKMHSNRPGHKLGLIPLAKDILSIRCEYGFTKGAFETANSSEPLPLWIEKNIEIIETIEEKAYNNKNFIDNLTIALTKIPKIVP